MSEPKIVAYLNPYCPWTSGVVAVLQKHGLAYSTVDISRDAAGFADMVRKSGQRSAPCVEVDGHMLADVGGDEVERYLREHQLLRSTGP